VDVSALRRKEWRKEWPPVARTPRPWYRTAAKTWCVVLDGRITPLAKGPKAATRAEAHRAYHAIMSARATGRTAPAGTLAVRDVLNAFLADVLAREGRGELSGHTRAYYAQWLAKAGAALGSLRAHAIRPHHLATLAAEKGWGPASCRALTASVLAAFRWATSAGHLASNPLAGHRTPGPTRREAVLSPADFARVREAIADDPPFADLILALHHSGCRSGEVYGLTAEMVDTAAGVWRVPHKTARKTGVRLRTVPLTPELADLSRRLCERHPTGPIFRNSLGEPWTRRAVAGRMRRLRARLGMGPELTAHSLRHLLATDMAVAGVPILTAAAVLGHTNSTMLARVYAHVDRREDELIRAVSAVRHSTGPGSPAAGAGGPAPAPAAPPPDTTGDTDPDPPPRSRSARRGDSAGSRPGRIGRKPSTD
jgi:integrase